MINYMSMGSEYWVGEIMPYLRLATRNSEEPKFSSERQADYTAYLKGF